MSVIGTKAATLQPIRFGWSKDRGHSTTKEWRGGESQVRAKIAEIIAAGGSYEVEQVAGEVWKIVASYSSPQPDGSTPADGDTIAVTWELLPKDAQKALLGSFHSLVSGLSQADIDQIKTEVDDTTKTAATTTLTGNALKVFKLMRAGVDTVEVEQPVLSLTWVVPDNENLNYAYANIGRVYTTSSLISTEAIPGYIATSMVAWTASFSNPTYGANRVSLVFGWKKRAPTQRRSGNNKREISQTWEFGLWATDIYGATV
jgi:hypothetical protein